MNEMTKQSRGAIWLSALAGNESGPAAYPASVRVVDSMLANMMARYIAVVPDENNRFPRARNGEVGLVEGWEIARAVDEIIVADQEIENKRPIIAVIDVASQAYGRREEAYGIHQALAGAAGAYARARLAGHPVIGLIVGKAMSGAFLAHGYQANRLIAINDPEVMVHAMGKASAARITMRSSESVESLARAIPPLAYDIESFASLGLLWQCLKVEQPDAPSADDIDLIKTVLVSAIEDIEADQSRDLSTRFSAENRKASRRVREILREQWSAASS
jgi:malonate decarboxylase gamma subunit